MLPGTGTVTLTATGTATRTEAAWRNRGSGFRSADIGMRRSAPRAVRAGPVGVGPLPALSVCVRRCPSPS